MADVTYTPLDLTTVVRDIGKAKLFYAAGAFAGSGTDLELTCLGDTEGEITIDPGPSYRELMLPELTGEVAHQKYLDGLKPVITVAGMFSAALASRAILSPTGSAHGGYDRPQAVTEYTLVIIPESVFREANVDAALAYTNGGTWEVGGDAASTAQLAFLDLSLWFWRVHVEKVMPKYSFADGGKELQEVVFHAMYNGAMPQGSKIFTAGRPDQASIEIAAA